MWSPRKYPPARGVQIIHYFFQSSINFMITARNCMPIKGIIPLKMTSSFRSFNPNFLVVVE
ncbi:hypothetical protein T05_14647 [Trichinella murrelli]|uniref:Uncharacterized protein n=1 Tax=Trichinella murrelli TaxID=144512 RepID=A0A0V0UHT0_9BILA|nr:hypothetical protein T05_14647 [Trichinella murrelli]